MSYENIGISVDHPTGRPNFYIVDTPTYRAAFSYRTVIGFNKLDGAGWVCRQNDWNVTTGKHLNHLDGGDHASRLPGDAFVDMVREAVANA